MYQVAVVIPTYNRPDYLERLLTSVRAQDFSDMQVIVVDDNSPNSAGYQEVIDRFAPDLALTYVRNETNRGAQFSRNRGVSLASARYVALVDDDDEWLPGKVRKQVALFESLPNQVGLIYSWADAVDESGAVVHQYRSAYRGTDLKVLLHSCFMPSPTIMVRSSVFRELTFDEGQTSCQDWDMWTRIVEAGHGYDVVEERLAIYHKHGRPSIGQSPKSLLGFHRFYTKHRPFYLQMGLSRNLSEKLRGLAREMLLSGLTELALATLREAIKVSPLNWKAWVRLIQARLSLHS